MTIKIKTLAAQNTEFWSAFSLIQFKSVCTQIGGSVRDLHPVFASLGVTMRSEITKGAATVGGSAGTGSPLYDHPASRLIRR